MDENGLSEFDSNKIFGWYTCKMRLSAHMAEVDCIGAYRFTSQY